MRSFRYTNLVTYRPDVDSPAPASPGLFISPFILLPGRFQCQAPESVLRPNSFATLESVHFPSRVQEKERIHCVYSFNTCIRLLTCSSVIVSPGFCPSSYRLETEAMHALFRISVKRSRRNSLNLPVAASNQFCWNGSFFLYLNVFSVGSGLPCPPVRRISPSPFSDNPSR